MAFITSFTCKSCHKKKREIIDGSGICLACRAEIADIEKRTFLKGLEGLDLEERIKRIEVLLYDLQIEGRLNRLESKLVTC